MGGKLSCYPTLQKSKGEYDTLRIGVGEYIENDMPDPTPTENENHATKYLYHFSNEWIPKPLAEVTWYRAKEGSNELMVFITLVSFKLQNEEAATDGKTEEQIQVNRQISERWREFIWCYIILNLMFALPNIPKMTVEVTDLDKKSPVTKTTWCQHRVTELIRACAEQFESILQLNQSVKNDTGMPATPTSMEMPKQTTPRWFRGLWPKPNPVEDVELNDKYEEVNTDDPMDEPTTDAKPTGWGTRYGSAAIYTQAELEEQRFKANLENLEKAHAEERKLREKRETARATARQQEAERQEKRAQELADRKNTERDNMILAKEALAIKRKRQYEEAQRDYEIAQQERDFENGKRDRAAYGGYKRRRRHTHHSRHQRPRHPRRYLFTRRRQ